MARYKRLECPRWATEDRGRDSLRLTEIEQVFARDGHYIDRAEKRSWIEFNGRAWDYPDGYKQAVFELRELLGYHPPLRKQQTDAVWSLLEEGFSLNTTLGELKMRLGCSAYCRRSTPLLVYGGLYSQPLKTRLDEHKSWSKFLRARNT